jgi:hypothetical protein
MGTPIGSVSQRRQNFHETQLLLWSTPLRVLVLYANPVTASFGAALHSAVVTTLQSRGHEIDDCDLYAEGFNPVMSEQGASNIMTLGSIARPSRLMPIGCWRPRRSYSSIRFGTRGFLRS